MTTPRRSGSGRPSAGRRPARSGTRSPAARASSAARPTAAPAGTRTPRPRRRSNGVTARAAVLVAVVATLVLSAALPVREFLAQRGEIAELRQNQTEAQARVAELEAERTRLADPAYVKTEARRRLHFVLPGETAYVLLQPTAPVEDAVGKADADAPWYSQLWGSVQSADRPQK